MKSFVILILSLFIMPLSLISDESPSKASLTLSFVAKDTKKTLDGVEVWLRGPQSQASVFKKSTSKGSVTFKDLAPGTYWAHFMKPGYAIQLEEGDMDCELAIDVGGQINRQVEVTPCSGITGTLGPEFKGKVISISVNGYNFKKDVEFGTSCDIYVSDDRKFFIPSPRILSMVGSQDVYPLDVVVFIDSNQLDPKKRDQPPEDLAFATRLSKANHGILDAGNVALSPADLIIETISQEK